MKNSSNLRLFTDFPDVGEGIAEAEIVEWHVNPGDTITEDQVMVEVMTDKATVELPSPVSGVVLSITGAAWRHRVRRITLDPNRDERRHWRGAQHPAGKCRDARPHGRAAWRRDRESGSARASVPEAGQLIHLQRITTSFDRPHRLRRRPKHPAAAPRCDNGPRRLASIWQPSLEADLMDESFTAISTHT